MAILTCASHVVSGDHFIANRRVASARALPVTSPIDGTPLGEIAAGDAVAAALAVEAAQQAFPAWAALGPEGRGPILRRLADLIERDVEALALVET
ncbi:MAG TPA: aldehyde dehydrogenase family protein, partial [Vicinamibacterales bacterium]|nr:aldehyde dehydrogenase family protein [Vicinamibacterales bacterium]